MQLGRAREYLRYALGEIALVIIGILIALQVNNWNEERIEQQQIHRYARALIDDLERDIDMVEPIIRQIDQSLDKIDALEAYTRGRSLQEIDNQDLYQVTSLVGYRAFEWHRSTFEQMQNSGALQKMRDFELASRISAYQAFTRHLDQDYEGDRERFQEAERLADQVVDSSYPRSEASEALQGKRNDGALVFPDPELHALHADLRLPLLTDDIRQVRMMSNKFQAAAGMRVRMDSELPRLVADARQIVVMLRKQYPE